MVGQGRSLAVDRVVHKVCDRMVHLRDNSWDDGEGQVVGDMQNILRLLRRYGLLAIGLWMGVKGCITTISTDPIDRRMRTSLSLRTSTHCTN